MLLIFVVLESQCGGDGGWRVWGALEFQGEGAAETVY